MEDQSTHGNIPRLIYIGTDGQAHSEDCASTQSSSSSLGISESHHQRSQVSYRPVVIDTHTVLPNTGFRPITRNEAAEGHGIPGKIYHEGEQAKLKSTVASTTKRLRRPDEIQRESSESEKMIFFGKDSDEPSFIEQPEHEDVRFLMRSHSDSELQIMEDIREEMIIQSDSLDESLSTGSRRHPFSRSLSDEPRTHLSTKSLLSVPPFSNIGDFSSLEDSPKAERFHLQPKMSDLSNLSSSSSDSKEHVIDDQAFLSQDSKDVKSANKEIKSETSGTDGTSTKKKRGGGKVGRKRKRGYVYNPKPLVSKTIMKKVPNEMKDEQYWEARRKNNEAAKISRQQRRNKELEYLSELTTLRSENEELRRMYKDIEIKNKKLESDIRMHMVNCKLSRSYTPEHRTRSEPSRATYSAAHRATSDMFSSYNSECGMRMTPSERSSSYIVEHRAPFQHSQSPYTVSGTTYGRERDNETRTRQYSSSFLVPDMNYGDRGRHHEIGSRRDSRRSFERMEQESNRNLGHVTSLTTDIVYNDERFISPADGSRVVGHPLERETDTMRLLAAEEPQTDIHFSETEESDSVRNPDVTRDAKLPTKNVNRSFYS